MALIYDLARFADSGMNAMQYAQRDWSPYLVHFTKATSLQSIHMMFDGCYTDPQRVKQCLEDADRNSYEIASKIIVSGKLLASLIQDKHSDPCVCFSECTLPGIIGHSERYGRFGFVFEKSAVYKMGGRPCLYVDDEINSKIKENKHENDVTERLWGLANVFRPIGKIQDYSHEREWRVFGDFELRDHLCAVITPDYYVTNVRKLLFSQNYDVPILPIDMVYNWGL